MVEMAQEGFMELEMKVIRLLYYLPMERMSKPKFIKEIEKFE